MNLDGLARFPDTLRTVINETPDARLRDRAPGGRFSLLEHAWHLGDVESGAYAVRIERLLSEHEPHLADFDGDAAAAAGNYHAREIGPGLERFAELRAANIARLRALTDEQWSRGGTQEFAGAVNLRRVVEMMIEHDEEHLQEIDELRRWYPQQQ